MNTADKHPTASWLTLAALVVAHLAAPSLARSSEDPGPKGRYLVVTEGIDLTAYRGAILLVEPSQLDTEDEHLKANEKLLEQSDELLVNRLRKTKLFTSVQDARLTPKDNSAPRLRVVSQLTLEGGSRGTRAATGTAAWATGMPLGLAGAGKAKLHILVEFIDPASGDSVAYYNGYGTSSFSGKLGGGGKPGKMFKGDLDTNYKRLGKLLVKEVGR